MNRKLNDTTVPEAMFQKVASLKRTGGKVFLVIGDDRALQPRHCRNCNGTGAVGMQYFTGGPFDATPTIQNKLPNANNPNDVPARATFVDGKWYKQKTRSWPCPPCEGTGISGGKRPEPRQLAI
jgi:hypothetical protein